MGEHKENKISKNCFVCAVATNDFTGSVVRWAFDSEINHVFVIYRSYDFGRWKAIQISRDRGVDEVFLGEMLKEHDFLKVRMFQPQFDSFGLGWGLSNTVRIRSEPHAKREPYCFYPFSK